jgi:hypothetical protein
MPAKVLVPVETFPRIDRFRGHGPPLGPVARGGLAAGRTNKGRAPCISPVDAPPVPGIGALL